MNWNKLNLEDEDKLKLIELLLVVGSILVAFKFLPDNVVWVFLLFVVLAIFVFIGLKKGVKKNIYYNLVVVFSSLFFSATLAYEIAYSFGVAMIFSGSIQLIYTIQISQILATLYFVAIAVILFMALKK